jgi:hypothetical protein
MHFRLFAMAGVVLTCTLVNQASVVDLNLSNLAANGWKATTTSVYGGSTNATVTEATDYGADSFRFFTGTMPTSWQFQWASISTDNFAGTRLSAITAVRVRNFGAFGDGPNWLPPTFSWVVNKGDGNQRCITWKPWSNGNAREPLAWHEYDAATTGQWLVEETGVYYNSLASLKTALPNAFFEPTARLPLDWGYASQQAFNVGFCPLYDQDRAWFNGTAGYVDWFEVGVSGATTRYNLVPEPTGLLLLALGAWLLGDRPAGRKHSPSVP